MYLTDSNEFITSEFSNLNLGDARLDKRVLSVASVMNKSPGSTIPEMFDGNKGQLKALYRFFRNEKITDQKLMSTHYLNTIQRMLEYNGKILIVCDSTFVTPTKGCEGLLTRGKGKDNCVRVHYALAISDDGKHFLGILNLHILSDPINSRYPELRNESDIWIHVAEECLSFINSSQQGEKLLARCLLVADREGDEFELLNFLKKNDFGFIIRSQYNRKVEFNGIQTKLDDIEDQSKRHGQEYTIKTKIKGKMVDVIVHRSALRKVTIIPPETVKDITSSIEINVVLVKEIPGELNSVKWRLLTSEEIPNASSSLNIVTSYTHRWKIEEVNKAAKTGVRIEDRQFTKLEHFFPFLSMAFIIGWRLVAIRTISQISPNAKLTEAFNQEEAEFLKVQSHELELPMNNVSDAVHLIAKLGGFTGKHNKEGWIVLWRGWMKFTERLKGFVLAHYPYSD